MIDSAIRSQAFGAELIEIRLDHLEVFLNSATLQKLVGFKDEIGLPLIFTLRPSWEGGNYDGSEEDRLAILSNLIELGIDYVDLEFKIEPGKLTELVEKAEENRVKIIISVHDFQNPPSSDAILDYLDKCTDVGADIAKVAFNCNEYSDTIEVLRSGVAAKDRNLKFTVMGMGSHGHITRLLAPLIGCEIVYTNVELEKQVVDGQIDIKSLVELWEALKLDKLKI